MPLISARVAGLEAKGAVRRAGAVALLTALLLLTAGAPAGAALLSWTTHGPEGGSITALAVDPLTPATVYAGLAGRGLFKSTNGGVTWIAINTGLTSTEITAIAIDPANAGTMYAGTSGAGVFRSTDGGSNWFSFSAGLSDPKIADLAIDPAAPATLYAATQTQGVFKSVDAGVNWLPKASGLTTLDVRALAIDPVTPSTVYAGTAGGGVFKTTSGGTTWAPAVTGMTSNEQSLAVLSLAIDQQTPAIIYAGTMNGVFKTLNAAGLWDRQTAGLGGGDVTRLVINPTSPNVVYAATARNGVFKSTNANIPSGDITWTPEATGMFTTRTPLIAIDRLAPATLYAGSDVGVFKTVDAAASWATASTGLRGEIDVPAVAIDPVTPSTVYAGTRGGVFKSASGGATWTAASNGLVDASVNALVVDPSTPSTLYAGRQSGGVWKSTDGAGNWTPANTGLPASAVQALAIDPQSPNVLYVGTAAQGVFRSTDSGGGWSPASAGLTNQSVRALVVAPGAVYAGTGGGVFKSETAGASWTPVNTGLTALSVRALAVDRAVPGILYAGTTDGVFKSSDAGGTWAPASAGITEDSIRAVVVDPQTTATLYAATSGGGVFRTVDAGITWAPLNTGLTTDDVRSLAISPSGACVHAGTFGGGVFDFATTIEPCTALIPALPAAILPSSRSVQVGTPATAFASMINSSSTPAKACGIAPATSDPFTFVFQTTDPSTNQVVGTLNTPVDIPGGGTQSFVIALTPTDTMRGTDVSFKFACDNSATDTPVIVGLNTLLLVASNNAVPDIVALAAAPLGTVQIPGVPGAGVFAVATVNLGSDGTITATADSGTVSLPLTLTICETDPVTSACKDPPAASVTRGIATGQTPTYGVFAVATGPIGFDPAVNRIFVRFRDGSGVTRGSTSAAVRTQ